MARTIDLDIELPVIVTPSEPQVQADWNQNDDTQPDYINNRTHYVKDVLREFKNSDADAQEVTIDGTTYAYYSIENMTKLKNDLDGALMCVTLYAGTEYEEKKSAILGNWVSEEDDIYYCQELDENPILCMKDKPSMNKGIYFNINYDGELLEYLIESKEIVQKVDRKFLQNVDTLQYVSSYANPDVFSTGAKLNAFNDMSENLTGVMKFDGTGFADNLFAENPANVYHYRGTIIPTSDTFTYYLVDGENEIEFYPLTNIPDNGFLNKVYVFDAYLITYYSSYIVFTQLD